MNETTSNEKPMTKRALPLLALALAAALPACSGNRGRGLDEPPPARCAGVAASIEASATWREADNLEGPVNAPKIPVIEVKLGKPGTADAQFLAQQPYNVPGSRITVKATPEAGLNLEIKPEGKRAPALFLTVAVECPAGPARVRLVLTPGAPQAGTAIPMTLADEF